MQMNSAEEFGFKKNFIDDNSCNLIINKLKDLMDSKLMKYNNALGRKVVYNPLWEDLNSIFFKYSNLIKDEIKNKYNLKNEIYPALMYLSTFEKGEGQGCHVDDEYPWLDFSSLLYLNDFEGGMLRFRHFDFNYKPEKNELVFWPSSGEKSGHEVTPVLSDDQRHTILICYTKDYSKRLRSLDSAYLKGSLNE